MECVIESSGGVGDDTLNVMRRRLEEVHRGDIVHRVPILVEEEVEGDAMLAQVLDMDERREYVLAKPVVDQDLVHLFVSVSTGVAHRLVQIQHPDYALCLLPTEI